MIRIVRDARSWIRAIAGPFVRIDLLQRRLPLSPQLSHHIIKCLFDIDTILRRGLNKFAAKVSGECLPFLRRHLALVMLVAFIAYQHDRDWAGVDWLTAHLCGKITGPRGRVWMSRLLDSLHLRIKFLDPRERVSRGDTVDQNKTLTISNPLISEGRVFFLTGGVKYF